MDDIWLADGFERAFLGVVRLTSGLEVAVYDRAVCITVLVERDGMSEEEAEEYFDFNVAGAYIGEQTPLYLERQAYPGYE